MADDSMIEVDSRDSSLKLWLNNIETAAWRKTLLTKSFTRSMQLNIDPQVLQVPITGIIGVYDSIAGTYAQGGGQSYLLPNVGLQDQDFSDTICTGVDANPLGPIALKLTATFEGSTHYRLWEMFTQTAQEISNYDKDGNLTRVIYLVNPNIIADPNPKDLDFSKPYIAPVVKVVPVQILRMTLVTIDPFKAYPWAEKYLARVNIRPWGQITGDRVIGGGPATQNGTIQLGGVPRMWLCTKAEQSSPGQNGVYRAQVEWVRKQVPWDQLGVYLTSGNTKPNAFDPIPKPELINSTNLNSGFDADVTGNGKTIMIKLANGQIEQIVSTDNPPIRHNGWRRFKMQMEADFNDDFTIGENIRDGADPL